MGHGGVFSSGGTAEQSEQFSGGVLAIDVCKELRFSQFCFGISGVRFASPARDFRLGKATNC